MSTLQQQGIMPQGSCQGVTTMALNLFASYVANYSALCRRAAAIQGPLKEKKIYIYNLNKVLHFFYLSPVTGPQYIQSYM